MTSPSIAKRRAARLAFVQSLYQARLEGAPKTVAQYHADIRRRMTDEEDPTPEPDFKFLKKLQEGFATEQAAVQLRLTEQMAKGRAFGRISPLMQSLLEAGAYELIYYPETRAKILLDEYVGIAAEFFDNPELGFVNGVLQEVVRKLGRQED